MALTLRMTSVSTISAVPAKWQKGNIFLARFLDCNRPLRRDRREATRSHVLQSGAHQLPSVSQPLPRVVAAAAHAFLSLSRLRTPGELGVNSADRTMLALRAAVHAPRAGTTATRRGRSAEARAGATPARAGASAAPLRLGADARRLAVSRGAWPRGGRRDRAIVPSPVFRRVSARRVKRETSIRVRARDDADALF